jgi:hypothetical protein
MRRYVRLNPMIDTGHVIKVAIDKREEDGWFAGVNGLISRSKVFHVSEFSPANPRSISRPSRTHVL